MRTRDTCIRVTRVERSALCAIILTFVFVFVFVMLGFAMLGRQVLSAVAVFVTITKQLLVKTSRAILALIEAGLLSARHLESLTSGEQLVPRVWACCKSVTDFCTVAWESRAWDSVVLCTHGAV